ncbi:hypothetical protein LINGRAHAP2_LOCUS3948 [Linum grandiflorum]
MRRPVKKTAKSPGLKSCSRNRDLRNVYVNSDSDFETPVVSTRRLTRSSSMMCRERDFAAEQRVPSKRQSSRWTENTMQNKGAPEEKVIVGKCRCSPGRITDLINLKSTTQEMVATLDAMGFGGTTKVRIGLMCEEFIRWAIEAYDAKSGVFYFMHGDALSVTVDDVERVYGLPRGEDSVNDAVAHYTKTVMQAAAKNHGLPGGVKAKGTASQNELKVSLEKLEDPKKWSNVMIIYIVAVLLCPRSHVDACLRFLPLIGKKTTEQVKRYNWCLIVESHFRKGIEDAQTAKKSGTKNIVVSADMHLLMVCFCEKYGNRGSGNIPYCGQWDNESFNKVFNEVKLKAGSTFPGEKICGAFNLPRPFKGLLGNLPVGWDSCEGVELEAMLGWCENAKEVIDADITILRDKLHLTKGSKHATPTHSESEMEKDADDGITIPVRNCSPRTPVGNVQSERDMGISPPSFNLGISQPSIKVAREEVPGTLNRQDSVPAIVEKVVPAVRERPKRIMKKSHITRTPYCVDDGRKKNKVVKKVPQLPKPPMSTFNSMKNLLIDYATNPDNETLPGRDDLAMTLSRNEFRSLDYDEELVADIVDSYSDLLNLRAMEESEFGPKRWIFRTTLAQEIHANIDQAEMEQTEYLKKVMYHIGLVDPQLPEEDTLGTCEFIFFPICDGGHYTMFVVNRRDKRFEFLDSLHPESFHSKWRRTADRVVKFAAAYYNFNNHGETFDRYEWVLVDGVKQPPRSKECGIYLLNWAEAWDGVVEEYMRSIWCKRDYCRNRRNSICIDLISWEENSAFDAVKMNALKWSENRRVIRRGRLQRD